MVNPLAPTRPARSFKYLQAAQKGPDARRGPKAAGEAYSLYVEPAAEGANEADGPFSAADLVFAGGRTLGGNLRPLDGSVADGLEQLEGNLEEVLHHVGIEVRPRAAGDLLAGRVQGDGHRVGPVEGHGIEGVRHREDPRPERDHLAADRKSVV